MRDDERSNIISLILQIVVNIINESARARYLLALKFDLNRI